MRKISLKFKKIMVVIGKYASIAIMSVGAILFTMAMGLIVYVVFTQTHNCVLEITDNDRKFLFEIMVAPCAR